jgi:hypothetical protein
MEFDADIAGQGEPLLEVAHDPQETVHVDCRCPSADIKRDEIATLEAGCVNFDFPVHSFLEACEERFLILDPVIGAVGTEVLAEGDMKIEPGILQSGGEGWYFRKHAETPPTARDRPLHQRFP